MSEHAFAEWWRRIGSKLAANTEEVTPKYLAFSAWIASRQNDIRVPSRQATLRDAANLLEIDGRDITAREIRAVVAALEVQS
jgi:hypothetical protein